MNQNNPEDAENLEIEPLSENELESVSGGHSGEELSCSVYACSNVVNEPL